MTYQPNELLTVLRHKNLALVDAIQVKLHRISISKIMVIIMVNFFRYNWFLSC